MIVHTEGQHQQEPEYMSSNSCFNSCHCDGDSVIALDNKIALLIVPPAIFIFSLFTLQVNSDAIFTFTYLL